MTVDLRNQPRDCDCITHECLHWLDHDKWWFESNLKMLRPRTSPLTWWAFCQEEARRCHEKADNMMRYTKDGSERFIFPDGYRQCDYSALFKARIAELTDESGAEPVILG